MTGWAAGSPVALVASVCFGVVALLLVPAPAVRRLAAPRTVRLPVWARPRPGAMPARMRLGAGFAGSFAMAWMVGAPWWVGLPVACGGGAAVAILLGRLQPRSQRDRSNRLLADLPHACELIAACLDAGLPLRSATRIVGESLGGPIGEELGTVTAQVQLGIGDDEAWRSLDHPVLQRLGRDLARTAATGVVAGAGLRVHAADATATIAVARQEQARKVGVMSVMPLMCCYLPAFVLLGIVPVVGGFVAGLLGGG